jgi:hypothetical protein
VKHSPDLRFRFSLFVLGLVLITVAIRPAAAQSYAEGISAVLSSTNASEIDTWSETYLTPDIAYYYGAYVEGYLYQNGSLIASGYADRYPYENDAYGELSRGLIVGDIYTVESDHYVVAYYIYGYDYYGDPEYWNPDYFLISNGGGSSDPSGWNFSPGGGPVYYDVEYLYLGTTGVQISSAAPHISGINPGGASPSSSGSITVTGSDLVDIFTGVTTPAITGSGVSLSVQSQSSTQVVLNYTVSSDASIGAHSLTLTTRFGTSNSVTFNVGYPPAVVTSISPSVWPAGQSNLSVTITGQNFGTSPTLSLSSAGVSLAGYTPNPNGQSIQATVNIAANAPNESVTVTVQPGYAGSPFACNCQGQSPNGTNTATVQANVPAPTINLLNGITNSPFAGQPISLSVSPPSGFTISSQAWSFSNSSDVVAGYNASAASGAVVPITSISATQSTLGAFYYIALGKSETVTVNVRYNMADGSTAAAPAATQTFTVQGPTANTLPNASVQTDDSTTVIPSPKANPATMKMGNSPAQPAVGIWINDPATLPQGKFIWVQILNSVTYSQLAASGLGYTPPADKGLGLDGIYPYPPATNSAASDAPARSDLFSFVGEVGESFDATMYVLWDPQIPPAGQATCTPATTDTTTTPYTSTPSTCASIPVPLASVHWTWKACAIDQLAPVTGGGFTPSWIVHCGPGHADQPIASGYPEWSSCNTSLFGDCRH